MGGALASNIVDEATSVMTSVVTDTAQNCTTTVNQLNVNEICNLNIDAAGNVVIIQNNIGQSNIDVQCTQTNSVQNSINANLTESISQISKATQGALGIGIASASNVTNLYTSLAIAIVNTFNQSCIGGTTQTNIAKTCKAKIDSGGTVTIDQTNEEFATATLNCIQQNAAVNNVKATIATSISQAATATVEGILGPLMFLLIIVVIIVIAIFVGPELLLTNPNFIKFCLILIVLLIVVYFIIAAVRKWWPFKPDNQVNPPSSS